MLLLNTTQGPCNLHSSSKRMFWFSRWNVTFPFHVVYFIHVVNSKSPFVISWVEQIFLAVEILVLKMSSMHIHIHMHTRTHKKKQINKCFELFCCARDRQFSLILFSFVQSLAILKPISMLMLNIVWIYLSLWSHIKTGQTPKQIDTTIMHFTSCKNFIFHLSSVYSEW